MQSLDSSYSCYYYILFCTCENIMVGDCRNTLFCVRWNPFAQIGCFFLAKLYYKHLSDWASLELQVFADMVLILCPFLSLVHVKLILSLLYEWCLGPFLCSTSRSVVYYGSTFFCCTCFLFQLHWLNPVHPFGHVGEIEVNLESSFYRRDSYFGSLSFILLIWQRYGFQPDLLLLYSPLILTWRWKFWNLLYAPFIKNV